MSILAILVRESVLDESRRRQVSADAYKALVNNESSHTVTSFCGQCVACRSGYYSACMNPR